MFRRNLFSRQSSLHLIQGVAKLGLVEFGIEAALGQESLVAATLEDGAGFEDENLVGAG